MSSKTIALILGSVALVVVLGLVLRGSAPKGDDVAADEQSPTSSSGVGDERLAARPNVFGAGVDAETRKKREQDAASDRDRLESGDPDEAESQGRRGENDGTSIDVRARLQDSSRPFDPADGDGEPGDRPPTGSAWRGDDAAVEGTGVYEPERTDPSQPVLSLFDGKGDALAADASIEKGVTFEDDGARFSADSELAIPMAGKINGEAGSISFWVRPEGDTSDVDNASLVQLRSHYLFTDRLQIWKDGASLRMVFADSTGAEGGALYSSASWADDEWRLVTTTWGNGETALYVNGELAGKSQFEGEFNIRPDTLLHIGSNYSEDPRSLNGTISQFRVYDRALDAEEIGALPSQYPE